MAENGNGKNNNSKSEKYTKKFDVNEISPLKNIKDSNDEQQPSINIELPPDATDSFPPQQKKKRLKDTFESTLNRMDISRKARLPFLLIITICAILIVTIIVLIATWPRIESYMKEDVCVKKECLDASAQILLWANTSADVCDNPYNWACGKFEEEYLKHEFYGVNGGEWNVQTNSDYQDIAEIHSFVAKLSSAALTSSAQLMLKGLHQACMGLEMLDKSESDSALKNGIFSLLGWIYGDAYDPHVWDFKQAMIKAHSQYGLSPFFKISVKNRNGPPFGSIITISEGEVGLPHKMFYQLDFNHRITTGYQMLMRDFAINMGVVSDKATKFAEQMYHFEKRIVTVIKSSEKRNSVMTLKEVQTIAPSLPIFETITTTFTHTKITEETMVLVRDVETLRQMSIIVSTTDESPLNSFITWSLSRRYMPFMSREYRAALEEFQNILYGYKRTPPSWYFCSKLLKEWVPFALDVLRHNPQLIVTQKTNLILYDNGQSETARLIVDRINYNHELLKLIFYHLRNQIKTSIDDNVLIDQATTNYIMNKLSSLQLQIGIPADVSKTDHYVNKYYSEFFWRKLHFIENIQSHWSFRKMKIEDQLKTTNRTDKIIAHLYPVTRSTKKLVLYSADLHAIIVSEKALDKPYFHHNYPLAVNFARIGLDISNALLKAVLMFGEQHVQNIQMLKSINTTKSSSFSLGDTACVESEFKDQLIPDNIPKQLTVDVASGAFTAKAFDEFLRLIKDNVPVPAPELSEQLTYSTLELRQPLRQVGLRKYDNSQLFSLALLQRHCAFSHGIYKIFKPFIENEIPQQEIFDITWNHVNRLPKSLRCSTKRTHCDDFL